MSGSSDTSNRKSVKLIPVNDSILFPSDNSWNQNKAFRSLSVEGKTSDIMGNTVINLVKNLTLKMKLFVAVVILWIYVLAEHSTMIKTVFSLWHLWSRNIMGIDFGAYTTPNCIQTNFNILPIEVETDNG